QFEFYFLVAHDVRIRRQTGLIALYHITYDLVEVLFFEIEHLKRYAKLYGYPLGVLVVLVPWTRKAEQILALVLHILADNVVVLFFKQGGSHLAVHSARHTDKHPSTLIIPHKYAIIIT